MKTLTVGIMNFEDMQAYSIAIAKGEHRRKRGEPKIWFTSVESFAKLLSDRNRALLALICAAQPESLSELAELSGRAKSNLSRTLKAMAHYGIVSLKRGPKGQLIPRVPYSDIKLAMPIAAMAQEDGKAVSRA